MLIDEFEDEGVPFRRFWDAGHGGVVAALEPTKTIGDYEDN